MKKHSSGTAGYVSFVLHAHLPYVLHHGTWPHGLEWLLEAAAETYLPLLRTLRTLQEDGIPVHMNVSLSPVLLQQLAHQDFRDELPAYLERKIAAAREDAGFFELANETHLLGLARHWERFFTQSLEELQLLNGDLIAGFRNAQQNGSLSLLTSAATHGYVPLLGTDESVLAHFRTAVQAHRKLIGTDTTGAWLPEFGYRPEGKWHFPVAPEGRDDAWQAAQRIGAETALAETGIGFTFVDAHLVQNAERIDDGLHSSGASPSFYRPYRIGDSNVAVLARDPRTAAQVWSPEGGYPGDFDYLDFHKKRWPGGHRYWRVTGANLGMEAKEPYHPDAARERSRVHAEHFISLVAETLRSQPSPDNAPLLLSAPFDLELFGHWWHEGVQFLENVFRILHNGTHGVHATTTEEYLAQHGTAGRVRMSEGSWGANGDNSVWLNSETSSLLSKVYAAQLAVRDAAQSLQWTAGGQAGRVARQMCRELLLMESSDWPTLITTGAARDYAEKRFGEHADAFSQLRSMWLTITDNRALTEEEEATLAELERVDDLFPDLNPADWKS
ncbi:1,4-alpha-glucan branching protein domain-containing protein [Terriglobus sp. TAA 43]|uniref:1,4-alpha-glucan branching protein domain-containing protein n=1 Tax=Terriglobus sp. TAA 43 TaxID=278961 RepID=UPI0006454FB9|nr:1,4-alpha-glucan branching protein domain-containing protein [Terriglobus sp. TAA 43]